MIADGKQSPMTIAMGRASDSVHYLPPDKNDAIYARGRPFYPVQTKSP
jgi:hypothetical protein